MRPLKLTMTGFESYKDRTEINFEKLGTQGLYLITGDTGAGKTTIFDAITFALYGSPSGTDRSVEMLRSHFADEKTPTVVELDFEAKGKKYNIVRNPDYERKSLRGEGTTKESANAVLNFLSESREPVSGVSKVTSEIEAILNLKKEQFCRIAMIAQGSFQKLLLSKKDEKEKIFRELFHTEKYEKLQNTLKSEKSSADQIVSDLNIKLHEALTRIEVSESDENVDKINQLKVSNYVTDDEIQILKDFVSKDEKLLLDVKKQISELENQLEKINAELKIGEDRQKFENQLVISEKQKSEKENELEILQTVLAKAEKNAEKIPDLEKEKTLLEASLKEYEDISIAEKELENLEKQIKADEQNQLVLEEKNQNLNEKIDALKKEQSNLTNAGEKIGTFEAIMDKISAENHDLEDIKNQVKQLSAEKEELEIAQSMAKKLIADFENANHIYSEKLRLFNLEQAGILAEGLEDGCACPVCGSKEHPQLAKKSEKAPTQQEIETSKNDADSLQKKSTEFSVATGQKKAGVEKSEEAINNLLKRYFEKLTVSDSKIIEKIENRILEIKEEEKSVNTKLQNEKKSKVRREEIEKMLPDLENDSKNQSAELSNLVAKISGDRSKMESESNNLQKKKTGLKYETLFDAKKSLQTLENAISDLKISLDNAKENKNNCEKTIEKINGEVESLKSQLKSLKVVDINKLSAKKIEFVNRKDELNNQRDSLNNRKGINQESVKTIETLVPQIAKAKSRYNMISALSEVAAGSSRGKNGKPSLETFVQMHCLDQINRRANLRLKTMTENKYELRRRVEEDGSELGLDLNIKDFYTGRERNVQTLSGGEQFQASLALALGLADEVQENSGGIKLDTMFIDEGFGTLDPETLNKAMKALEELSSNNRLIGIISHVEELESRIPKKIHVKKDQIGVSHAEIEVE